MKKLFFTFTLLGLFALSVPRDATAKDEAVMDYPANYIFCGHTCWCWDPGDYVAWDEIYCGIPD